MPTAPATKEMEGLVGTKQRRQWLLSQSFFGWPSNRPRLYTVMVRKDTGWIEDLNVISKLYRVPQISADAHLIAPPESLHQLGLTAIVVHQQIAYSFVAIKTKDYIFPQVSILKIMTKHINKLSATYYCLMLSITRSDIISQLH